MCIGEESIATEYDLNGNILSERGTDSRGKWSMTWTYDGDGRLLKYTWSGSDGSTHATFRRGTVLTAKRNPCALTRLDLLAI